jgi:hypothetical protein
LRERRELIMRGGRARRSGAQGLSFQRVVVTFSALLIGGVGILQRTSAQDLVTGSQASGLNVAPAYEGWQKNADGSFNMLFGYFNRNWEEQIDVPIGPDNSIEPGGPDQGQPTHLLPRRNFFVFKVRVPEDFGNKELVWTLTSHGKTERAYATLKPEYVLDDNVISMNFGGVSTSGLKNPNKPPTLMVEASNVNTRAGQALSLVAMATDDGVPARKSLPPLDPLKPVGANLQSAAGLRLSWFVYRGAGNVTFDPPQSKVYMDMRSGSPWTPGWQVPPIPRDNKWTTKVTFDTPGTYVLRCLAHDGALQVYQDVTINVS